MEEKHKYLMYGILIGALIFAAGVLTAYAAFSHSPEDPYIIFYIQDEETGNCFVANSYGGMLHVPCEVAFQSSRLNILKANIPDSNVNLLNQSE